MRQNGPMGHLRPDRTTGAGRRHRGANGHGTCQRPSWRRLKTFWASGWIAAVSAVGLLATGDAKIGKVCIAAEHTIPAAFSSLDLEADGVRVIGKSATFGHIFDERLPGGTFGGAGTEGWSLKGGGTKWVYSDKRKNTSHNGFRKFQLVGRS